MISHTHSDSKGIGLFHHNHEHSELQRYKEYNYYTDKCIIVHEIFKDYRVANTLESRKKLFDWKNEEEMKWDTIVDIIFFQGTS